MYAGLDPDDPRILANEIMAGARVGIEWGFGDVYNLWQRLSFTKSQKLYKTLPAQQLQLAFFLTNCRNTVHPNQVQQHFKGSCPTLESYIECTLHEAQQARIHNKYPGMHYDPSNGV